MKPTALTRAVSPLIEQCELTHLERVSIDVHKAVSQHGEYERALRKMGYRVRRLPETPHLPDGVFVEDTAVVLPEVAVITRPGAPSRRQETETVREVLREYRELRKIDAPGTLDGGDVLVLGRQVYIGCSGRTNPEGIRSFTEQVKPFGYSVCSVPVKGCLHLKTGIAVLEEDLLLVNPEWIDETRFEGCRFVRVHPEEPFGANVLQKDHMALCPESCTHTRNILEGLGYDVITVDQSEMAKAEAGVTCCSVIVNGPVSSPFR